MGNIALQMEKFNSAQRLLPQRGPSIYSSGINDREKGFVLYGPKSSDEPILIIVDPIYDKDRKVIAPGYYELMLSYDRQNLILTQKQQIIAVIPVFKIEEDKSQVKTQPKDWKAQKKADKEEKKKQKKLKKLAAQGKMPEEPGIYNNATIEYEDEGNYYLIKYERGKIQAWGAIKM